MQEKAENRGYQLKLQDNPGISGNSLYNEEQWLTTKEGAATKLVAWR